MTKRSLTPLSPLRSLWSAIHRGLPPLRSLSLAVLALVVISSCVRRPLEVYYQDEAYVRFNFDWLTSFGFTPNAEDIQICIYRDGDQLFRRVIPNQSEYYVTKLPEGRYYLMVFTPEDDWTGSARFDDIDNYSRAVCRAEPITVRSPKRWDAEFSYMCDPYNPIGVAVDTFEITREMVEHSLNFIDYRDRDIYTPDTAQYVYNEIIDPMTTHLYVRILVKKGYQYIRRAEANISGFADGFWMNRVDRTYETGTLLLDQDKWQARSKAQAEPEWNIQAMNNLKAPLDDDSGWIIADLATFGLPLGKERIVDRDSTENVLNLAFLLRNDSTAVYQFNVGKRLHYETPSGDALSKADVLKNIEVYVVIDDTISPTVDPVPIKDASGFDAHVDDWEYGGTFDVSGFARRKAALRSPKNSQ